MTKLLQLLLSLGLFSLSACSTFQVHDYKILVQLPASGDCFEIGMVSKQTKRYPKAQCELMVRRAIHLTSDNFKLMREDIQQNCQQEQCTQLVGRFDNLFIAVDKGLDAIPINF